MTHNINHSCLQFDSLTRQLANFKLFLMGWTATLNHRIFNLSLVDKHDSHHTSESLWTAWNLHPLLERRCCPQVFGLNPQEAGPAVCFLRCQEFRQICDPAYLYQCICKCASANHLFEHLHSYFAACRLRWTRTGFMIENKLICLDSEIDKAVPVETLFKWSMKGLLANMVLHLMVGHNMV